MSSTLFIPNDVLETIVCLNCANYLSVFPVYTKVDGSGAVCGRCKFIDEEKFIRDEAYEGIAQFLVFPCRYSSSGCKDNLTPTKLEQHEQCCEYRKFDCISKNYSKCQWKGARSELVEHFQQKHPNLLLKEPLFELSFVHSQEEHLLLEQEAELFIVKKEVDSRKGIFSCSVRHLKASEDSETYHHALKIESGNKNYFYKCPEKSTCENEKLHSTQLTADILRERLQDPATIIVNIQIMKAQSFEPQPTSEAAGEEKTKQIDIKNNPNINWDMLSELECPICYDYMLPPIFQCINGHSICKDCKTKVSACAVCKVAIQETKNFVLEKMTQHMVYPCKFYKSGCQYACKSTQIKDHESGCEFGPYSCPLKDEVNCEWKENHPQVGDHIDNNHNEYILKNDKADVPFNSAQETRKSFLIKYQKKIFKLIYLYKNEKFFWSIQLVGPANESKNFRFEVDVIDLSNAKRRCYFTGLVQPLATQEETFKKRGKYIVASLEQLDEFATDKFCFRVRVIKE